jgi:hypothetical protein
MPRHEQHLTSVVNSQSQLPCKQICLAGLPSAHQDIAYTKPEHACHFTKPFSAHPPVITQLQHLATRLRTTYNRICWVQLQPRQPIASYMARTPGTVPVHG